MQVRSPTARASGACGFAATAALAKPGAGRAAEWPGSSGERLVAGSPSIGAWALAEANATTSVITPMRMHLAVRAVRMQSNLPGDSLSGFARRVYSPYG